MASKEKFASKHVGHGFPPFVPSHCRLLVLGSFPSVKSREQQFFYGHPQNRFWATLGGIYGETIEPSIPSKKAFLEKHGIALYDVIEECDVIGSSDASIKNVVPADVLGILRQTGAKTVLLNGKKAGTLFEKHFKGLLPADVTFFVMPSTSPANAAISLPELIESWKKKAFF